MCGGGWGDLSRRSINKRRNHEVKTIVEVKSQLCSKVVAARSLISF